MGHAGLTAAADSTRIVYPRIAPAQSTPMALIEEAQQLHVFDSVTNPKECSLSGIKTHLASNMLSPSLFVVHNASGRGLGTQ